MNDLGPDSRALLDSIRDAHDPDEADRARVRAAVMRRVAIGAAVAATATAAAKTTAAANTTVAVTPTVAAAGGSALFLKGIAILALLGGVGVAVPKLLSKPAPATPPAVTAVQPVAEAPVAQAPVAPPGAEPAPKVVEAPEAPAPKAAPVAVPPAPVPVAPKAVVAKPAAPAAESPASLAADLAAIRDAHAALKAGDPARALALTDTIPTSSPVAQERAVVRILAHCAMGSGQDVAARFLEAHPGSPSAPRIRGACGLSTP